MDKTAVIKIFECWNQIFSKQQQHLTELDSVGGDGDLGIVMADGFKELETFAKGLEEENIGKIFYQAGKRLNQVASSSMGTLLSSGFKKIGKVLNNKTTLEKEDYINIVGAMADGVKEMGGAEEGEKTFLDAIYPAARAMKEKENESLEVILESGVKAAEEGVENAKKMVAKQGRLAFRGEGSIGITDPGSVVALYFVEGIRDSIK